MTGEEEIRKAERERVIAYLEEQIADFGNATTEYTKGAKQSLRWIVGDLRGEAYRLWCEGQESKAE